MSGAVKKIGVRKMELKSVFIVLPHIFLMANLLTNRSEVDMAVGDIRPVDGFKTGVLEKSPGVSLESLESARKRSELESDFWCKKSHFLVMQVPFGTQHGNREQNTLLASEEMGQRLFIKSCIKPRSPITDKGQELVMKKGCPSNGGIKACSFDRWAFEVFQTQVAVDELLPHAFGSHVDDFGVGEIEEQKVVDGLRAMPSVALNSKTPRRWARTSSL